MSVFTSWLYDDRGWSEVEPGADVDFVGRALLAYVHDSDYAEVRYVPAGRGTERAFLNDSARSYFGTEDEPTSASREADGLADWWALSAAGDPAVKAAELRPVLFDDEVPAEEGDDVWDEAVFAESKLDRLVALLDLPPLEAGGDIGDESEIPRG